MKLAGMAIGLFAGAFVLHWLVWRVRVPHRQTSALLAIFFGTLAVALAADLIVPLYPLTFWSAVHISIFHSAMALAYIVAYSAIEERSPSMALVTFVADADPKGRSSAELNALLETFDPLEARLAAMLRDEMIERQGDDYVLTGKGRQWALVFSNWRRLLGRGKGG